MARQVPSIGLADLSTRGGAPSAELRVEPGDGDLVDGRFRIERLAGSGSMGRVYRAEDQQTGEAVALKVLRNLTSDAARFAREATVLASLEHPAIVRFIAHGVTPERIPWVAMEWLEGEDLSARLDRQLLSLEETMSLLRRVAEALALAHARGVVHRDVKPHNIFLVGGAPGAVKLVDFGLALLESDAQQLTQTGMIVGTVSYMAPEQAFGARDIDGRADLYALGCVAVACLTGHPPFFGADMRATLLKIALDEAPRLVTQAPGIPASLDDLVARLLAKSRGDRPNDATALIREIDAIDCDAAPTSMSPQLGREERLLRCVAVATSCGEDPLAWSALEELARRHGVTLKRLRDGTAILSITSAGAAVDRAAQVARCALLVHHLFTGASVVLVADREDLSSAGSTIDRLEALLAQARAGAVSVDPSMEGLLQSRFALRREGGAILLDRERPPDESPRTLLGRATSFVGRDREILTLEATWRECIADSVARAVLVTGPAGIGKTRLWQELVRRVRLETPDADVWLARGDAVTGNAPLSLLGQALRRTADIQGGESIELANAKLHARVSRSRREDVDRIAVFLGEIASRRFLEKNRPLLREARRDPMRMKEELRAAFADFTRAECAQNPVILVLEDLHRGDAQSVELVEAALGACSASPLLVLALARPDVKQVFPALFAARNPTEIALPELSLRASERLATELLGDASTAERVAKHAMGNALFLEELIRAAGNGRDQTLPESVLAMIDARLESLPTEQRRALRAASVFGETFWRGGVVALIGGTPRAARTDALIQALEQGEWIARRASSTIADETEYAFRHAIVREAAYWTLTDRDRATAHGLVATWLEERAAASHAALAAHLERAGAPERAAQAYVRAGFDARKNGDFDAVCVLVAKAKTCGASGHLLGEAAYLLLEREMWRGDTRAAAVRGKEALEQLRPGSSIWLHAVGAATIAGGWRGEITDFPALVAHLLDVRPDDDATEGYAFACSAVSTIVDFGGVYDLGARLLARLEDHLATRGPEPCARAWLAYGIGMHAGLAHSDAPVHLQSIRRSIALFIEAGEKRMSTVAESEQILALAQLGAFEEAETEARAQLAYASETKATHMEWTVRMYLARALSGRGALAEACAEARRVMREWPDDANPLAKAVARYDFAHMLFRTGELEEAETQAHAATADLSMAPGLRAEALATLARIQLTRGKVEQADATAREAFGIATAIGVCGYGDARVWLVRAETAYAAGDIAAAHATIATARERLRARAATAGDYRTSFVERPYDNALTMELARAWLE